jgi:hypothetical protein
MQLLDIDFAAPATSAAPATPRWESKKISVRNAEPILDPLILDPAHDPAPALTSALYNHARLLRQRLDTHPDVVAQQAAEKLAKGVVTAVMNTLDVVNAEFGDILRVGLMLSAGRPGLKKMSITLTDRLDLKRRMECSVQTALVNGELVLSAECLGRIVELARVKAADSSAPAALRDAVERHVIQTAGAFAESSADRHDVA